MSWWRRFPNPDVLSRFAGYRPAEQPVNIMTLPSGFTEAIGATNIPAPVLAAHDPTVGQFVEEAPVPLGGPNLYIPAWTLDGAIGILTIGESPIGWLTPYHGTLTFTAGSGGIGQFAIGVDAIGVGAYPSVTERPWPASADLTVFGDVVLDAGYSGYIVQVRWGDWPFALPRAGEA